MSAFTKHQPVYRSGGATETVNTITFPKRFQRALRIGINYRGTSNELHGCIEDLDQVDRHFAMWGVSVDVERRMTDDTPDSLPTRENILAGLDWLVTDAKAGDVYFMQYSGHGAYYTDSTDAGESDHQDETLCPIDMDSGAEMIRDNEIQERLARLPAGVKVFFLCDCCHSGTNCDLAYQLKMHESAEPEPTPVDPTMDPNYYVWDPYYVDPHLSWWDSMFVEPGGYYFPYYDMYYDPIYTDIYQSMCLMDVTGEIYYYPQYDMYYTQDDGFYSGYEMRGMSYHAFRNMVCPTGPRPQQPKYDCSGGQMQALRNHTPGKCSVLEVRDRRCDASIISFSGCRDDQTSQEFDGRGLMTTAFCQIFDSLSTRGDSISIIALMEEMYSSMANAGSPQRPQVCTSFKPSGNDTIQFEKPF